MGSLGPDTFTIAPLPPAVDILLEVRTGKIRHIAGTTAKSAIEKLKRTGRVFAGPVGLTDDEQSYKDHGGIDKTLHGYCSEHYLSWKLERPSKAHLYRPGGYGENFVFANLNEHNLCIGDKFSVGNDGVIIEISEPRQPCYQLNLRFEWNKASLETQRTGRTGWYMRVLKTGYVEAGDEVRLVERPNPTWSVSYVQSLLYGKTTDREAWKVASQLPGLGWEISGLFEKRLAKGIEDMSPRLGGLEPVTWKQYLLQEKETLTPRVTRFVFTVADQEMSIPNPELQRFSHVRLRFGPKSAFTRAYSVVSGDMTTFELGISKDDESRGGSTFLHHNLHVGDSLDVARGHDAPSAENLPSDKSLDHFFIVGGIGITAFLRQFKYLESISASYSIHYAVRSSKDAAYRESLLTDRTTIYASRDGQRMNLANIIPLPKDENGIKTKIYTCGPPALMKAVRSQARSMGYPATQLHFEDFGSETMSHDGPAFDVRAQRSNKSYTIPSGKSILEILNAAGFEIPSSCEVGNCGNCSIGYIRTDNGEVQHRGVALSEDEKCENMLSCVSRGTGELLLDL